MKISPRDNLWILFETPLRPRIHTSEILPVTNKILGKCWGRDGKNQLGKEKWCWEALLFPAGIPIAKMFPNPSPARAIPASQYPMAKDSLGREGWPLPHGVTGPFKYSLLQEATSRSSMKKGSKKIRCYNPNSHILGLFLPEHDQIPRVWLFLSIVGILDPRKVLPD